MEGLRNTDFLVPPSRELGGGPGPGSSENLARFRRPAPSYRHGTPSGPWPFLDIGDDVDSRRLEDPESHLPLSAGDCQHYKSQGQQICWCKYPQALYPNWTKAQQKTSRILRVIDQSKRHRWKAHYIDVHEDGVFEPTSPSEVDEYKSTQDQQWKIMTDKRPQSSRARVVFISQWTGPALQMFGMRYNIEPFFFSSTIGGIPSRFQSNVSPGEGDHITLTLSFMRALDYKKASETPQSAAASAVSLVTTASQRYELRPHYIIDTQSPLPLISDRSKHLLAYDFLAVHMVRRRTDSTIISLHSGKKDLTTPAEDMYERFRLCGKSVYWSSIFKSTGDPTFLLLCLLWYVMYAWDEVFEKLYSHICYLEDQAMSFEDIKFTQELHVVRAHLLHYESLMDEFRKTVEFVARTENPVLDNPDAFSPDVKELTRALLKRECDNLLRDISRLERSRNMQDKRLKNVMDLSFSLVTIAESRGMAALTEASVKDSAAMKQIAYMTMFLLPPTFVASIFSMNIIEINPEEAAPGMTLSKYFAVAIPLTAFTIWIVIAYQFQIDDPRREDLSLDPPPPASPTGSAGSGFRRPRSNRQHRRALSFPERLLWPIWLCMSIYTRWRMLRQTGTQRVATRYGVRDKFS